MASNRFSWRQQRWRFYGWLWCATWLCCEMAVAQTNHLKIVDTSKAVPFQQNAQPETQTLQYLLSRLPVPYEPVDLNRSRARIWTQTADNACMPWLRKTPKREQEFFFSQPYMVESAIALVTRRQSAWTETLTHLAAATGAVSLHQLITPKKSPVLSVDLARSYGDQLDSLLQTFDQKGKVMQRNAPQEQVGNHLHMLDKGFIDATLEYPKIVARSGLALQLWPVQEAEPFNLVYFACSKTSDGARSVQIINQLISDAMQQQDYQRLALAGIPPDQQAQALKFWQQAVRVTP